MDTRKASPRLDGADADATPAGELGEARLQHLIGYQVAQAAIVTFDVFERLVGRPMELRPVEYTILTLIDENPDGSPAQLSKALAVTPPNITSWVDKLEKRGLVARQRNLRDRRGQHLRTTEAGAALVKDATARLLEGERETLSALTPGERLILGELLHKVARLR